jgi:hypothetical protein
VDEEKNNKSPLNAFVKELFEKPLKDKVFVETFNVKLQNSLVEAFKPQYDEKPLQDTTLDVRNDPST